ncbi:MAG TPA: hypothetical protein PK511_14215 [Chitinophagales bacterium]|nr:hypothetical protein [Cyclobacteriaceae bacterium]HMY34617.1 hypothetical protein [bacterium]HNI55677.1 hypothetical protein [Chitinophagales bacterium]HMY95682.1 hypothetical protein [Cyclobacteriaceae bacterium]HNA14609.1 hypothetical protein [Cyclobacteriaceae bacterium]
MKRLSDDEVLNDFIEYMSLNGQNFYSLDDYVKYKLKQPIKRNLHDLLSITGWVDLFQGFGNEPNKYYISPLGFNGLKRYGSYLNYLKEIKKSESLQMDKLWYEVNLLKREFEDYPETKKQASDSLRYSKISILVAILIPLLILMLQWTCNKHVQ